MIIIIIFFLLPFSVATNDHICSKLGDSERAEYEAATGHKMYKGPGERWEKLMEPNCPCKPDMTKRYTIALLSSIGFMISFGIRCNMGVAIVEMVSNKTGEVSGAGAEEAMRVHWLLSKWPLSNVCHRMRSAVLNRRTALGITTLGTQRK